MSKLIALVAIAMSIGEGAERERITVEPGDEVVGLNPVDVADLKACGAIQDTEEAEALAKKDQKAEQNAAKEFAQARKAVQAAHAAQDAVVPRK